MGCTDSKPAPSGGKGGERSGAVTKAQPQAAPRSVQPAALQPPTRPAIQFNRVKPLELDNTSSDESSNAHTSEDDNSQVIPALGKRRQLNLTPLDRQESLNESSNDEAGNTANPNIAQRSNARKQKPVVSPSKGKCATTPKHGDGSSPKAGEGGWKKGVPDEMEHFKVTGYLGRGTWAVVHECVNRNTGVSYAVKTFDKRKISSHDLLHSGKRETRLLKKLFAGGERHPNICSLVEVLESRQWYHMFVVLGGRELQNVIEERPLTEERARRCFKDLLTAVAYIHKKGVCHRDIKPSNLLDGETLMLTDFGLGDMAVKGDDTRALSEVCGTPDFIAPEVLTARTYEGTKVDMWSCGVTLYAMVTGKTPWVGSSKNYKMKQIKEGKYQNPQSQKLIGKFSPEFGDMLHNLLQLKSERRLDAVHALQHPFITGKKLAAQKPLTSERCTDRSTIYQQPPQHSSKVLSL